MTPPAGVRPSVVPHGSARRWAKVAVCVAACIALVGSACARDAQRSEEAAPTDDLAGNLESELRATAAASGIEVPDGVTPSDEQLAALADGEVTRAEVERQKAAFHDCLEQAGFEVSEPTWDPVNNVFGGRVGMGTVDEPGFKESPFRSPTYVKCYGTHHALVSTQWTRQSLPDAHELRETARKLLACAAEAGYEASTLRELGPMVEAEFHRTGDIPGDQGTQSSELMACVERFRLRTATAAEMDAIMDEKLR